MTHHSLYQRLGRVDLHSYGVLVATILMIVVVSLIALAFVPQSWLTSYLRDADPTLSFLSVSEDARYMLAPIFLSGAAPVFAFVLGIVSAAESRSFLGAGVTREAMWRDGRRTNIGISLTVIVILALSIAVAAALDGTSIDSGQALSATGIFLLSLLAAFEIGYFLSMLFTRLTWLPALIICIAYSAGLLVSLSSWSGGWDNRWTLAALVIVAFAAARPMTLTLPMRRAS